MDDRRNVNVGGKANANEAEMNRQLFLYCSVAKKLLANLRKQFLANPRKKVRANLRKQFLAIPPNEVVARTREEFHENIRKEFITYEPSEGIHTNEIPSEGS